MRALSPSVSARPRPATSRRPPGARRRPLISLTPLIDVVFILLVFFMLASSFLDWRAIDLKPPVGAAKAAATEGALLIELRPEGARLAGEPLSTEQLLRRVAERLREKPAQRILLKPSAGVALQDAVQILDRLAAAGVTDLSLIRGRER